MSVIVRSGSVLGRGGGIIVLGGGGSPTSNLATLVSGMTSGTWSTWTGGALSSTLTSPSGADPVISNGTTCNWDPVRNWLSYYGHGHTGGQSLVLDYVDSTNTWGNANPPPIATGGTQTHQFLGQTIDSVTGNLYWFDGNQQSSHIWQRIGTSWTDLGLLPQGQHGQFNGAAFNPNYGTSGGAFFGGYYGIDVYDVHAGSYTLINSGFGAGGLTIGDPSNGQQTFGFYDVTAQAVYFGTVDGSVNSKALVKVASNGTCTQKSALPANVAINTSSSLSQGQLVDGYTSTSTISGQNTSGTVRPPLLIVPSGAMYSYNSGADTWSTVAGVTNPDATNANNGMFMGVCPAYDCAFLFGQSDSSGGMTAHVFKR